MSSAAEFFDRQAERFGPTGILPHHEARAETLRRIAGPPPQTVLELGCGAGGSASACARLGYNVTAVEISPRRAAFARDLANAEGQGLVVIHEGDFYTELLKGPYDVVTYWNGFGVGTDSDQRKLLQRVVKEWLSPGGLMLVDVFNPGWWARLSAETTRIEEYDAYQRTVYVGIGGRFVDRWWSMPDESDAIEQSVRCYSPPDLSLLLAGTGLMLERIEVGGNPSAQDFDSAYSYLAILRSVSC